VTGLKSPQLPIHKCANQFMVNAGSPHCKAIFQSKKSDNTSTVFLLIVFYATMKKSLW